MKIHFLLICTILILIVLYVEGARRPHYKKPNKNQGAITTNSRYMPVLNNVKITTPPPKEEQSIKPSASGIIGIRPHVVNGFSATEGQFPFAAALFFNVWFCSSSLIHPQWILTAAHCTKGTKSVTAYLGAINFEDSNNRIVVSLTLSTNVRRKNVFTHEKYSTGTLNNDIGLIKLSSPLAASYFTSGKLALSRLPTDAMATMTFVGTNATACGWGLTQENGEISKTLNYAEMPVIPNANCSAEYGSTVVTVSVICTDSSFGSNICSGDSGGPLLIKETDGNYTQIGISSFGSSYSCLLYPSGFTRLTSFGTWIKQTTGGVVTFRPATYLID